jgi:hypothetical protein
MESKGSYNCEMRKMNTEIRFNVHEFVHRDNILVYNSNKMHKSFYLTTAVHVSGATITHLQENKTALTTGSGNRHNVIDRVKFY